MPRFDAAVIGAGILGLSTAIELATNGRRVLLVERARCWPRDLLRLVPHTCMAGCATSNASTSSRHRQSVNRPGRVAAPLSSPDRALALLMPLHGRA
jgi:glycine/D-amino acid oxidase-like deaminating enzyme